MTKPSTDAIIYVNTDEDITFEMHKILCNTILDIERQEDKHFIDMLDSVCYHPKLSERTAYDEYL